MPQLLQDQLRTVAILNFRTMNDDQHDESQRVDKDVTLAPVDILAGVVTLLKPAVIARFNALRVQNCRRRLALTAFRETHGNAQIVVDLLPDAIATPSPEVSIDGLPRRVLA